MISAPLLVLLCAVVVAALFAFTRIETRRIETRYPPRGVFVDDGGSRVHVIDTPAKGEERGAILMIHGASGNAADLQVALAKRLCDAGFRVLSADRPGHGWSARIAGADAASPSLQARALRKAAEALGVSHATVIAHSLAGMTGLAMALDAPGFVRALVLIAPVSHPWPTGVAWYYTVGAHPVLGPPFRWLLTMPAGLAALPAGVASVFAPAPAPPDFIEATGVKLMLRPLHFRANCEDVVHAVAAVTALSPRYPEITAPIEIVSGDRDGVVSLETHSQALAREVASARLTILPGVGHAPHHVLPERIVAIALEAEARARKAEAAAV